MLDSLQPSALLGGFLPEPGDEDSGGREECVATPVE